MHETELQMLYLEQYKPSLIRDGRVTVGSVWGVAPVSSELSTQFDVAGNLRLVPKVFESDPDTFCSLFERVADRRNSVLVAACCCNVS